MNIVHLLLGGNLGKPKEVIAKALQLISIEVGTITAQSKYYITAAWGNTQQPDFINLACVVNTHLAAQDCLKCLLEIEKKLGRVRLEKWGARLIDIDILYFNNEIIKSNILIVPHPEMHKRKFALIPLCEIASDKIHPIFNVSNQQLLENIEDSLSVKKLDN